MKYCLLIFMLTNTVKIFAQETPHIWFVGGTVGFGHSKNQGIDGAFSGQEGRQTRFIFSPYIGRVVHKRWDAGIQFNSSYAKTREALNEDNHELVDEGWSLGGGLFFRYNMNPNQEKIHFVLEPSVNFYYGTSETKNRDVSISRFETTSLVLGLNPLCILPLASELKFLIRLDGINFSFGKAKFGTESFTRKRNFSNFNGLFDLTQTQVGVEVSF
ncbi:MAG: hypothetical protein KDC53_15085 [Saprospiraceae bacterium]|nr:hypothetical protein [Saprospiraceae bacterium]